MNAVNPDSETQRARWEASVDAAILELKADATDTKRDIREIHDTLAGRPSWAVTALITTLTTACGVLGTLVAVTIG